MKVNVVSSKLIKPSTPTPQSLKHYQISLLDALLSPTNIANLLFYPSKPKQISHSHLEESLAKILTQFYPLAGRYIKKDHFVDCSDQGAEFVQAEAVDVELVDVLRTRTTEQLTDLLPPQFYQVDEAASFPLLSIQITQLKCGGLVIAISISHRVLDASSLATFIAAWSNAGNPEEKVTMIIPSSDLPSLLPCKNEDFGLEPSRTIDREIVVKKFSFNKEAIQNLKSKLRPINDGKRGMSRVRVVCALIAKALIGLDRAKYGKPRACLIFQLVNLRERTIPPLPKHSCGNLALTSPTRCMAAAETHNIGIQELVDQIGDGIDKSIADCAEILSPGRDGKIITDCLKNLFEELEGGEVNLMAFSDATKFGFYEEDFGWGKPLGTSIGPMPSEKVTVLMSNKEGDGIEAWVHLKQSDMHYFEQDEEIRLFAS